MISGFKSLTFSLTVLTSLLISGDFSFVPQKLKLSLEGLLKALSAIIFLVLFLISVLLLKEKGYLEKYLSKSSTAILFSASFSVKEPMVLLDLIKFVPQNDLVNARIYEAYFQDHNQN